jgi:acyl transferase domain-containing protein
MAQVRDKLTADGAACRELKTSHAFHSAMMDPILADFGGEVARVRRQPPSIPIISSLHGRLGTDEEWTSPTYWSAQLRRAVRFSDAMGALLVDTSRVLLEVGPGNTLSALARQHPSWQQNRVSIASLGRKPEEGLLPATGQLWQAGVPVNWSALHMLPRRIALPTYPFQRQRHWVDPTAATTAPPVPAVARTTAPAETSPEPIRADAAAVEKLIDEQMRIMARQLEVLRAVPMNGKHS